MKILLAHKFFKVTGGAEVFFFETDRVLRENGHEVIHFSTAAPDNIPSPYAEYFVEAPEYKAGNILRRAAGIGRVIYSSAVKAKFAKLLADTRPDLVHVFAMHVHLTPSILVAASEAGVPVVMSCNDYKHICPNYKLYHHGRACTDCAGGKFRKAVTNRCCQDSLAFSVASSLEAYVHDAIGIYRKHVHTYLFASEFMAKATEQFWGRDSFRWRALRNPFDSRKFPLMERSDGYALFFGRLVEEKGVDVLIRAAALVPHVPVKIVGDGPQEEALKALAVRLGARNVEFVGAIWGDRLNALLAASNFVVVPSVWHENFPYVINQSFAYGKAVIGSDRGGIPELITHGERGLIYPAHEPRALADAMSNLWRNQARATALGRNAKSFSDAEFNDERFYHQLMSVYSGVLDDRRGARGLAA